MRVEPRAVDPSALVALRTPAFDYDLILWSWESDPDPNLLLGAMISAGSRTARTRAATATRSTTRSSRRRPRPSTGRHVAQLVLELQEIVCATSVYVIPFYPLPVQAFRTDRFTGWLTDTGRLALEDRANLTRCDRDEDGRPRVRWARASAAAAGTVLFVLLLNFFLLPHPARRPGAGRRRPIRA